MDSMGAVTNHRSGSTRLRSLVVAVAASVTIAALIGLGALTGLLPNKRTPTRDEVPLPRADSKPTRPETCALCGTIESIRTIEVLDDATAGAGAGDAKSGVDSGGSSVLDTLSEVLGGNEAGRSARKRFTYRVTVRMDDGSFRAISLASPPTFAVGEKVRVVEGRLVRS